MNKKTSQFVPMVKLGRKYKDIEFYTGPLYVTPKALSVFRKEIEEEYPKYKGKVVFFEYVLEKTSY